MERNALGPAETIINTLTQHTDHLYHGRPGMVTADARTRTGVRWAPVTHRVEPNEPLPVVYRLRPRVRVGLLQPDNQITVTPDGAQVAEYRPAGLFPEVAKYMYDQVAAVWHLDNEFAARWASYAYTQDHRDLKVVLAAFMLVQSRCGAPVRAAGPNSPVEFHDADFRDVGEAMLLLYDRNNNLNPKLLLRIHDLLTLPAIAQTNRDLGFGVSTRKPFLGRWPKAVTRWLQYREENPQLLDGLVKAGFRTTVMQLARHVRYKPLTPRFFAALRWRQHQATDGRRTLAIGAAVAAAESWADLSEEQICQRITTTRPNYKRIVGLLPQSQQLTRAIMAAAIEAGALSNKDLVILTPTLEELGLLEVQSIRDRWQTATRAAEDTRAANIARNVKSDAARDALNDAADAALQSAVATVEAQLDRKFRVHVLVDCSGSMDRAIDTAKDIVAKFVQAFPPDRVHVAVFNTSGRELTIPHPSAAGVRQAFMGIRAGGGTDYGAGVRALAHHPPAADEELTYIMVGDSNARDFVNAFERARLAPIAFGFVPVGQRGTRAQYGSWGECVERTAAQLEIPCFEIDESTFDDVYAIPRTIANLIASTPVGHTPATPRARVTLVDQIIKTDLLAKPVWAAAGAP